MFFKYQSFHQLILRFRVFYISEIRTVFSLKLTIIDVVWVDVELCSPMDFVIVKLKLLKQCFVNIFMDGRMQTFGDKPVEVGQSFLSVIEGN